MKTHAVVVRGFFLLGVMLHVICASAQEFSIRSVELTESQVVIRYDLLDTTRDRSYTVFLYSSKDNFLSPLTKVSGDVDIEVRPGQNRKIVWDAKAELGADFEGEIELEVRGRVYVRFIQLIDFDKVTSHKRGVPFMLKWRGGTRQNILDIRLYRGEKLIHTFPNAPNNSEVRLTIDKHIRPAKNYYLQIADSKNKEQVVKSSRFSVKRKYPLAFKLAIGAAAVAGAIVLLAPPPPPPAELEPPLGVPSNKN